MFTKNSSIGRTLGRLVILSGICLTSTLSYAHYPILDCKEITNVGQVHKVVCQASFSNRATAPNVIMEVFSEDDEVISSGLTNEQSMYEFPLPEGDYFILMDAGPGHVLEISNDEVLQL